MTLVQTGRPLQDTMPAMLFRQAARLGARVAMRRKEFGIWRRITWDDYARHVRWVGHALLALGLQKGERVAVIGENRPEWLYSDLGIQAAGGATTGIYATNSAEQVHYILDHSGARVVIVEGEEQLDKLLEVRNTLPRLERIIVIDPEGLRSFSDPMVMMFGEFLALGRRHEETHPGALEDRTAGLTLDDVALLIYTSGTTGPPKGAMLTYGNVKFEIESSLRCIPADEHDEVLSYLPLAHIAERSFSVILAIYHGYTVNFAENLEAVPQNLREVRPTLLFSVPRIWEKLYSGIHLGMLDAEWPKRAAFALALSVGKTYSARRLAKRPEPAPLRAAYALARTTVLMPLRHRLGLDRVRIALSAAAPISPDVLRFFWSIGVEIREIYGQTEGTGLTTAHRPGDVVLGTVGKPMTGIEVRIASDGEILVQSPGVFTGYFKDPELTARTVVDGWLHTGDVGEFDAEGNLRITDRKKDIFINAYGKNIAPQYIENKLKFSPYINDAVVIGDGKKYLTALIVIDEDNISKWAQDHRVPFTTFTDLSQSPEVRKVIAAEVEAVNRTLSSPEQVKKFALLPKRLYQEDGEVTPTMKVKRKAIMEKFGDVITDLYRE
ncbi:MAG: AMP-binding protein [Armatimonadetes bacterium]|nr:AMP-binding protein [Armatimonadota bacterium]